MKEHTFPLSAHMEDTSWVDEIYTIEMSIEEIDRVDILTKLPLRG